MNASDFTLPDTSPGYGFSVNGVNKSELDTLPASVDTERSILGCILLDPLHLADLLSICHVEDFSLDSHRLILRRMEKMEAAGIAIDTLTLVDQLVANKEINAVGQSPVTYINGLVDGVPRRLNIKEYADRVLELSMRRKTMVLASELTRRSIESAESVSELLAFVSGQANAISEHSQEATLKSQSREEWELLMQQRSGEARLFISSGCAPLDLRHSGYAKGEMTVIAGRPGQGKSILVAAMAVENCTKGIPGYISSVEMRSGQLLRRIWSRVSGVPFYKIRISELMSATELSYVKGSMQDVENWPLRIDDSTNLTASDICHKTRVEKRKRNIQWNAIDYLQKLHFAGKATVAERSIAVGAAAIEFAKLAKSEYIATVLLSSISEKGAGRNNPPTLQDLRMSGDISFEASSVFLIHREIDEKTEKLVSSGQIIAAKGRSDEDGAFNVTLNKDFLFFE